MEVRYALTVTPVGRIEEVLLAAFNNAPHTIATSGGARYDSALASRP